MKTSKDTRAPFWEASPLIFALFVSFGSPIISPQTALSADSDSVLTSGIEQTSDIAIESGPRKKSKTSQPKADSSFSTQSASDSLQEAVKCKRKKTPPRAASAKKKRLQMALRSFSKKKKQLQNPVENQEVLSGSGERIMDAGGLPVGYTLNPDLSTLIIEGAAQPDLLIQRRDAALQKIAALQRAMHTQRSRESFGLTEKPYAELNEADSKNKLYIVIIDDKPKIHDIYGKILQTTLDAHIESFYTPEQAIDTLQNKDQIIPDLIICDNSMGSDHLSGIQTVGLLTELYGLGSLPILALTGDNEPRVRKAFFESGAQFFFGNKMVLGSGDMYLRIGKVTDHLANIVLANIEFALQAKDCKQDEHCDSET